MPGGSAFVVATTLDAPPISKARGALQALLGGRQRGRGVAQLQGWHRSGFPGEGLALAVAESGTGKPSALGMLADA